MFSFLGINGDFGRFSLYLKVEHLALFNFSIYTIIRTPPIARKMQAGNVHVNGAPYNISMPFGGYKQSGIGREGGIEGFEEYLETKSIFI